MAMTLAQDRGPVLWKAFLWSAFWSAILTALARWLIDENNPCFQVLNDEAWIRTITGLIWFWLLLFLFFDSNRNRLILLGCSVIFGAVLVPNVLHSRIAAGESAAVGHIRNLAWEVEAYRKQHPEEGYPKNLPTISSSSQAVRAEKLYEIVYKTVHSNPGGPADKFLIQETPRWRPCGFIRSFAVSEDGLIHYVVEMRPATVSDPAIQ